MDDLKSRTTPEDTVVVYFSGHGYRVDTSFGPFYFLMPNGYDTEKPAQTAIRGDEFRDRLAAIPAQKLLLLLDCCHAGGLDGAKGPDLSFAKAPLPAENVARLAQGEGRVVIASSCVDELSCAGKPYSAFTLALHAREKVPQRTGNRQHPILHYEAADNFRVAWYAGGDPQPKGLPFPVESIEIEPRPGAWRVAIDQRGQTVVGNQQNINAPVSGSVVAGNVEQIGDRHYYAAPSDTAERRALEAEQRYLCLLRRECNRLPLAEDSRAAGERDRARAELANVYVDLQIGAQLNLEQVFDRLHVPAGERPALHRAVKGRMTQGGGRLEPDEKTGHGLEFLLPRQEQKDLDKHPLRRYVKDEDE